MSKWEHKGGIQIDRFEKKGGGWIGVVCLLAAVFVIIGLIS